MRSARYSALKTAGILAALCGFLPHQSRLDPSSTTRQVEAALAEVEGKAERTAHRARIQT